MKKIISFSLWGDKPIYNVGAIKNVELAKVIYPDWICRFYVGASVPKDTIDSLLSFDNVEIFNMDSLGDWTAMFWRFYPASEPDIDILIVRDCDSRVSLRERDAVFEWIESEKGFHIMRDHPHHNTPILGGMWGAKKGVISNMKELIDNYQKGDFWQVDQNFLATVIFPLISDNCMIHDEYFDNKPFPTKRNGLEFVGEKITL